MPMSDNDEVPPDQRDPYGWGFNLAWLSDRREPRPDGTERGRPRNSLGIDEESLGPEWGRPVEDDMAFVESTEYEPHGLAIFDFERSSQWREWLIAFVTDDLMNFVYIEDRTKPKLLLRRNREGHSLSYYVPVEVFFAGERPRDVYRRLERDLYVYAAKKFGWPKPPALPPYHELAETDSA